MIVGIGLDIQGIAALAESLQSPSFVAKNFSPQEVVLCQRQPRRATEHFAGKFAIKEAYMKAIGAGIYQGVWFSHIEVLNHATGAPYVVVTGKAAELTQRMGTTTIHITISHTEDTAIGLVILEKLG